MEVPAQVFTWEEESEESEAICHLVSSCKTISYKLLLFQSFDVPAASEDVVTS